MANFKSDIVVYFFRKLSKVVFNLDIPIVIKINVVKQIMLFKNPNKRQRNTCLDQFDASLVGCAIYEHTVLVTINTVCLIENANKPRQGKSKIIIFRLIFRKKKSRKLGVCFSLYIYVTAVPVNFALGIKLSEAGSNIE